MIKSLAHVCIKTTDLEKTTDFYCGALRMEKAFHFIRRGTVIGFYIKASQNTFIEVFHVDHADHTHTDHTLSHLCLQTDAIEDLHKRLVERGYSPRDITMGADNTTQFWCVDPNGLDIEFQQYTEKSSQLTGNDVEVNW